MSSIVTTQYIHSHITSGSIDLRLGWVKSNGNQDDGISLICGQGNILLMIFIDKV